MTNVKAFEVIPFTASSRFFATFDNRLQSLDLANLQPLAVTVCLGDNFGQDVVVFGDWGACSVHHRGMVEVNALEL